MNRFVSSENDLPSMVQTIDWSTPRAFSPWIPNLIEISTLTRSREEFLDVLMSTGLQSMIFLSHQPARCSAKQPPNDAILCVRLDFVDRKPLKTRPCLVPSTKKDSTGETQRRTITTQQWLTWDESSDTYCFKENFLMYIGQPKIIV